MTLWRYTAVDMQSPGNVPGAPKHGEIAGVTAADVRASLRRIGLQVIELAPSRRKVSHALGNVIPESVVQTLHKHMRSRHRVQRSELYDSLATMLSAGLPLMDALQTLIDSGGSGGRPVRSVSKGVIVSVRERLKSGGTLAQALGDHPDWFDATDVAIVEAGQHSGNLPTVLASMAQRQEKSNQLSHKLLGALAYPFLIMLVGIGVAVFLSIKTLPELVKILDDAKVPAPQLTLKVMWVGQLLAHHWLAIVIAFVLLLIGSIMLPGFLRNRLRLPRIPRLWQGPRVLRTLAVAAISQRLSDLLQSGVPMVEALRVIAPTASSGTLRQLLMAGADRIERGDDLSAALNDEHWFNAEFCRLLDIGQTTGELDVMLQRIGERYQRQAQRLIDRLATLLEPVVILSLAILVGVVVMAAILPLIRLQEVLR